MLIRDELSTDHASIAALHRAAFGGDYEANLVAALRGSARVLVSRVAVQDEKVVGHVMFSSLRLEVQDREVAAAALAPLAVAPAFRRKGHGSSLVSGGIDALRASSCAAIIVLGDPAYYRRFGFSAELTRRLAAPFAGPTFMALELCPGVLAGGGSVTYPLAFGLNRR